MRSPMSGPCRKTARPDQVVHADRHGDRYEADRCDHRMTEGAGVGRDAVSGERVEEDGTDEGLADRQADPLPGLQDATRSAPHQWVDVHQRQRLVGRNEHALTAAHHEQRRRKCQGRVALGDVPGHAGHGDRSAPERDGPATTSLRPMRVTTRPERGADTAPPTAYAVTPIADSSAVYPSPR